MVTAFMQRRKAYTVRTNQLVRSEVVVIHYVQGQLPGLQFYLSKVQPGECETLVPNWRCGLVLARSCLSLRIPTPNLDKGIGESTCILSGQMARFDNSDLSKVFFSFHLYQ
jgi:hypothetical protein